jgi:hypothetical protein
MLVLIGDSSDGVCGSETGGNYAIFSRTFSARFNAFPMRGRKTFRTQSLCGGSSLPPFVLGANKARNPPPIRMLAAFQVVAAFGDRFFETLDAVKNRLLLWAHTFLVPRLRHPMKPT